MNAQAFSPFISQHFTPSVETAEDVFAVGDVVSLIIGGPPMVVIAACQECGDIDVRFTDSNGDVLSDVLPQEALVHWDDDDE
ncbi:YodC family protein [Mesorhizobium sp. M0830]|uniref:hypothetical protein n=1 Tax=Mesorhizobium sp. M0830 TaxID=2957008 RepID=UPI003334EDEF